jgi:hypothetical protein
MTVAAVMIRTVVDAAALKTGTTEVTASSADFSDSGRSSLSVELS